MHLHELLGWPGPLTHRQFVVWQAWLAEDLNSPSRADYYAMQVAHEARYAFASRKAGFDSKKYTLPFRSVSPGETGEGLTEGQLVAAERSIWRGRIQAGIDASRSK